MRKVAIGLIIGLTVSLSAQPTTRGYQPWATSNTLLAADATKSLQAAPGAGRNLVVTKLTCIILTAGAQAVDVESSDGAVDVLKIPVSAAVSSQFDVNLEVGIFLPVNTALRIQPAAAAPAIFCIAEGSIRGIL